MGADDKEAGNGSVSAHADLSYSNPEPPPGTGPLRPNGSFKGLFSLVLLGGRRPGWLTLYGAGRASPSMYV